MTKTILVASDLSGRSERALRRAFAIAAQHDAQLIALSVIDDDLPAGMVARMQGEAQAALEQICAEISDRKVTVKVVPGAPVQTILTECDAQNADLLVLGTHRARPFRDMVAGTTMERIVNQSRRPVIVVTNTAEKGYQTLLAGIDLSPSCARAMRIASEFCPDAKWSTFYAVHVPFRGLTSTGTSSDFADPALAEAYEALQRWWQEADLPDAITAPEPRIGAVMECLSQEFSTVSPDLLVIGAHGRPALSFSRLGSITEMLLRDPPCDILVARR